MIRQLVLAFAASALVAACAGERAELVPAELSTSTTVDAITTTTTTTPPGPPDGEVAPDGRRYPGVATSGEEVAERIVELERLLRITDPSELAFADLAHEQQMHFRHIGRNTDWLVPAVGRYPT